MTATTRPRHGSSAGFETPAGLTPPGDGDTEPVRRPGELELSFVTADGDHVGHTQLVDPRIIEGRELVLYNGDRYTVGVITFHLTRYRPIGPAQQTYAVALVTPIVD